MKHYKDYIKENKIMNKTLEEISEDELKIHNDTTFESVEFGCKSLI